jgi:hypothetical protein
MDPLSIAASIIAVCQCGDRVLELISKARRYLRVPEEIDTLVLELRRLKIVLGVIETATSTLVGLSEHATVVQHILLDCDRIVNNLEDVLSTCRVGNAEKFRTTNGHRVRLNWVRKRSKVENLKQQLRDAVASLTLLVTVAKP